MEQKITEDLNLAENILNYLKGTISHDREERLIHEMEKNGALKSFIEEIQHEKFLNHKAQAYRAINLQEKWQKHLAMRSQQKFKEKKLVLRVAAALIPLVIAGSIFYYYSSSTKTMQTAPAPITQQTLILPGTDKAMLILGTGEQVALDRAKTIQPNTITATGSALIYSMKDAADTNTDKIQSHTLIIPRGGQYRVTLPDGTIVWLNAETTLQYPSRFVGNNRIVQLTGEAFFEVAPDENKPFVIQSGNLSTTVLGTTFNISAYKNEAIKVTVATGKVQVELSLLDTTDLQQGTQMPSFKSDVSYLTANQQATYNIKENSLTRRTVFLASYISWKDGRLAFKDDTLEDIIARMARWYDFEPVFSDDSLKGLRFTGNIERKVGVEDVLALLEKTQHIKFSVHQKTITIMNKN